jgi:hypothetical protein
MLKGAPMADLPAKKTMPGARRALGESGSVAIQIGLMAIAIMGFVALGTEVVFALFMQQQMQSAADAAAVGGATALMTGHPTDPTLESRAVAAADGFTNGINGATVTVNHPPLSGPNTGNAAAVEVIISQPQQFSLLSLFVTSLWSIGARAVATEGSSGSYCVLALDPSASGAVALANSASMTNANCGLAVNSTSSTALTLTNSSTIYGPVTVAGGWSLTNSSAIYGSPAKEYASVTANPYANVQVGTPPACTSQSGTVTNSASANLNPGHFCSGWSFTNSATVTLAAGTYYVDSQLTVANSSTLTGTAGVTIIVNGNYAINIANSTTVTLTAPTSGTYSGIVLMSSPTATSSITQSFVNSSTLKILGAVYFPNQIISYSNSSSVPATPCTQIIGRIIQIQNSVDLNNSCAGTGTSPIGGGASTLVE